MANAKTFIPKDDSFERLELDTISFDKTSEHFGYHPDQLRLYSDYQDFSFVWIGYKIFTDEIIHIAARHEALTSEIVERYTVDYSAKYDSADVEDILDRGIENESLTSEYLSDVLKLGKVDPNGSVVSAFIGYELTFLDGKLIGYSATDGLNKWAKLIKKTNPKLFSSYVIAIRKRGGTEEMVREEINAQCDAFATIPQGLLNPLIDHYRSTDGTIDFVKLHSVHYS